MAPVCGLRWPPLMVSPCTSFHHHHHHHLSLFVCLIYSFYYLTHTTLPPLLLHGVGPIILFGSLVLTNGTYANSFSSSTNFVLNKNWITRGVLLGLLQLQRCLYVFLRRRLLGGRRLQIQTPQRQRHQVRYGQPPQERPCAGPARGALPRAPLGTAEVASNLKFGGNGPPFRRFCIIGSGSLLKCS